MSRYVTKRLTFANTISVIALMVALGGGAYAVQIAPENSVGSKSVRNQSLRNADISKEAIRSGRIENGQVKAPDIGLNQVRTGEIKDEAVRGRDIRDGNVGAAELGTIVERSETIGISNGDSAGATVPCSATEKVTGGGAMWDTAEEDAVLLESARVGNGWTATGWHNAGGAEKLLTITAQCLAP